MKGNAFRGDQTEQINLGTDVDISSDGNRIVITGDGLDTRSTTNPQIESRYPQIQVYDWNNSTSTWDEVDTLYSPDADSTGAIPLQSNYAKNGCAFGAVASLSSDGSKLIASAPGNALTSAGRLLEYEFVSSGSGSSGSGSTWLNVSGEVYSSLDLTGQTSSDDGDQYRCFLTASGFSDVISNTATIQVTESGVSGVSSTRPSLLFDRNATQNSFPWTIWKATGKNWTYPGWDLIKEQTQWEYSSDNLFTTATTDGADSLGANASGSYSYQVSGRTDAIWNYYLVAVPPSHEDYLQDGDSYNNDSYFSSAASLLQYATELYSPLSSSSNAKQLNSPFTADYFTQFQDTESDDGTWNRSARFRTRVVLSRMVNGVEEQVVTNYSEWSEWRSDPAGNVINEDIDTIFTTHPTNITLLPTDNPPTPSTLSVAQSLSSTAVIAGTNKRYAWVLGANNFNIADTLTHNVVNPQNLSNRSQFTDSLGIKLDMIKFSAAKDHTLRCIGAADWKKAVSSNAVSLNILTTDNANVQLTAMEGDFTGLVQLGILQFDPIFSVQDLATGGTLHNNVSKLDINTNGDAFFTGGMLNVYWETSDSYGVSDEDWSLYRIDNVSVTDSSYATPQINNAGNVSVRVCWRFYDMDIALDSNTYQNVTTVWSNWMYIS